MTDTIAERRPTGEIPTMQPDRQPLRSKLMIAVLTALATVLVTCGVNAAREWIRPPWATTEDLAVVKQEVLQVRTTQGQILSTLDGLDKTVRERLPEPKKKKR